MKSLLKVVAVGSAVAFAVAMTPSTSFAGERFEHRGHGDDGWATFGKVITGVAAFGLVANVIDHVVPHVVVGARGGYCPPPVAYAPAPCGYYAPAPVSYCGPTVVVVRPEVRYCAPVQYYGGHGYERCDYGHR